MTVARYHLSVCLVVLTLAHACSDDSQGTDATVPLESGICDPSSCSGCCQGSRCQSGTEGIACGAAGLPCVVCQSSEVCAQGQCLPFATKCNPASCPSGCCQEDQCMPGTTNEACGKGGLGCASCASSQKCEDHSCGCSPSTCSGCCDDGVCRSGTEDAACGSAGAPCSACGTGKLCSGGQCVGGSGCSSLSCKGCCLGDDCKPGTVSSACGTGGQACKSCGATETCTKGVCNDPTVCSSLSCSGCCAFGTCYAGDVASSCGKDGEPCMICSDFAICESKACKLSPSSSWGITVVKADLDSSTSWDSLVYVEPDAYVEVAVGSQTGKTSTKDNSYAPVWNEFLFTTTAGALASSKLLVTVYDDDPMFDQVMGACSVEVPDEVLLSGGGLVNGCGTEGAVKLLELKFTLQ